MRAVLALARGSRVVFIDRQGEERAIRGDADLELEALFGSHRALDDAALIAAFSISPLGIGESVGAAVAGADVQTEKAKVS